MMPNEHSSAFRVLLVDDDEGQYALTRAQLDDDAGDRFDVEWAPSFEDGLRRFETGHYDVALVDYRLGEKDGLELLRSTAVKRADVPAIMMTGAGDDVIDRQAMEAGAVHYLIKQYVTPSELKRALRYAIEGHRVLSRLRQHEGSLQALLEEASDVILLVDRGGRVIFASDSVEHLEGRDANSMLGRNVSDGVHDADSARVRRAVERCASGDAPRARVEYRQQHADGTWRHREATIVNRLAHPGISALVFTYRDVTARKAAEARQAQLATIVESSADAMYSRGADGAVLTWNAAAERMFGYAAAEIVGRQGDLLVPPADREAVRTRLARVLAGETITQVEATCLRRDGTTFPALLTISPMRGTEDEIAGVATVLHDITEHRKIQVALAESEAEYRSTFDEAPVGIAHATLDGRVLRANARLLSMFGADSIPAGRIDFDAMTHPDDRALERGAGAKLYAGELDRHITEKRFRRQDGRYFWGQVTTSLHRDAAGQPKYLISMVEDVTERREAREELAYLFNLSPDLIALFDFEGRFQTVNRAWIEALGYQIEELCGREFMDFVHPEDRAATLAQLTNLRGGQPTLGFTNRYRTTSGSYRWFEWQAVADVASGRIYAVARDTTDRRSLEHQLNQSQKMEAVGRLAGGVAHDFNNLLTAIMGFSEMTLDQLEPGDPRRADMEEVMKAAHSAAGLTRQLLAFSRKQIMEPQLIDLNAVVTDTQKLLRRLIGEDVELVTDLCERACKIFADPGQIEQVIVNLALNARDAMPDGGTLHIATRTVNQDVEFVNAHPGAASGPHLRMEVRDTGTGMPPEVVAHAFEPFFTTKPQGKGTGLGLATVYGIVKQSGGYISVASMPGEGTTFAVSLPCTQSTAAGVDARDACALDARGTETILVVEDQHEVRDVIHRALSSRGYRLLDGEDGDSALAVVAANADSIDLLVTDVVMPGMSGRQLAERVAASAPDLRVLYMSGYTDDEIVKDGVLSPGIDFIRKPFTSDQLAARVRAALDRPRRKPAIVQGEV